MVEVMSQSTNQEKLKLPKNIRQIGLPEEKKKRKEIIESLKKETRTCVFYESPHRIISTLSEMEEILGGERRMALCRELTKVHEEIDLKTIEEHVAVFREKAPRGEYVMVLEGISREALEEEKKAAWDDISVTEPVEKLIAEGLSKKEAIKKAALERGSSRNEIYNLYEKEKKA